MRCIDLWLPFLIASLSDGVIRLVLSSQNVIGSVTLLLFPGTDYREFKESSLFVTYFWTMKIKLLPVY